MRILKAALIALPIGVFAGAIFAIFTASFWGWFEAKTGIESLGHSGPAGWVYIFCFALCSCPTFFWARSLFRDRSRP